MDSRPLQHGTWFCGSCQTLNLAATADVLCPACGHMRDYQKGCCTNAGEYPPSRGLFPAYSEYRCADAGQGHGNDEVSGTALYGCEMVDSPVYMPEVFTDIWTCTKCGAENLDWCSECPLCGTSKEDRPQYATAPATTTFGPAGSPAQGSWYCPTCGCSNSAVHGNQCGACGVVNEHDCDFSQDLHGLVELPSVWTESV
jgi:rubrerythrin